MTHIGSIIQSWREERQFSRLHLSKDICTEKYLYMIEREMRTPSAEILDAFGIRLGVNLFDYFPYLDCDEPRKVLKHMNKINAYRWTTDFSLLQSTFEETKKIKDFQKTTIKI